MLGLGLSIPEIAVRGGGNSLVFSGNGATIPEDTAVSSSLGTFSVTGGSGTYAYAITAGNGAGKFSLNSSSGVLTLAGALDYETTTSYALTITADNSVTPVLTLHQPINVGDVLDTAATLTSPTGTQTGATTATGTVTTDQASGTMYAVVTTSATPPSNTQVKAGQDNAGAAAAFAGNAAATLGTNTVSATGLAGGTTYYFYFMQENAVPLKSSVSASAGFATLTAPTISAPIALTSSAGADNTYAAGDVVQATVTFSASVTVTGTPQLTLNVGGSNKTANYASGSPGTALVFSYTIQAGDTDTNGISIGANALALNSGTIKDTATGLVNATITHSSVADNASHKVDTTAPSGPTLTPLDDAVGVSLTNDLTAVFSEAIAFNTAVVIGLYRTSDDTLIQGFTATDIGGGISISSATLTINPSADLTASTGYYVTIGATSIKDLAGNFFAGISSKTTWNFTSGTSGPTLTYKTAVENTTAGTSFTFTGVGIGAADATRRVIVTVGWHGFGGGRQLSSATIGGVSATIHKQNDPYNYGAAVISAVVPTGTTADVVLTMNNTCSQTEIGVWTSINEANSAPTTAAQNSTGGSPQSITLNVPSGGFVIAASNLSLATASSTQTWSGTGIDKQYDALDSGLNTDSNSGASRSGLAANATYTVTVTRSGAAGDVQPVGVSWA